MCLFSLSFLAHGTKLHDAIPAIVHMALKLYGVGVSVVKAIKRDGFPVSRA